MSTLKIICNITYKINATSSLHSTVINSLNDVLQVRRTIVQRKMPFVIAYSKALRRCYSDFFVLACIIVLIKKRGKKQFLPYHDRNYFSNQILKTEEIHSYIKVRYEEMGGVACGFLRKGAQAINSKYDGKELRCISFWVMHHSYSALLIPHHSLQIPKLDWWSGSYVDMGRGHALHSWAPSSGFYLGRLEKTWEFHFNLFFKASFMIFRTGSIPWGITKPCLSCVCV